jgi:hypothetical protein
MVVAPGEVWAFPTMRGISMNPWSGKEAIGSWGGPFESDGWGALIILDSGRAYDWFPWCTYAPIAIQSPTMPTLEQVRDASTAGAEYTRGVPRARQFKRAGGVLLGRLPLDEALAKALPVSEFKPPEYVVYAGWAPTVWTSELPQAGPRPVRDLLAR